MAIINLLRATAPAAMLMATATATTTSGTDPRHGARFGFVAPIAESAFGISADRPIPPFPATSAGGGGEGGEGSSSFLLSKQMRFRGAVAEGYGRGGKKLGFPTANLPSSLFADALSAVDTGVYFGWAVVEGSDDGDGEVSSRGHGVPQKAVVNVGYSPTFEGSENAEKIIEAHLMPDEGEGISDFYGNVMRLSLIGFLRSEKKFDSFPDLIAAINNDVECAKNLLDEEAFASFKTEKFVSDVAVGWVGPDGGDEMASWQIQDMQDA